MILGASTAWAGEETMTPTMDKETTMEEVSVTATRMARPTQQVAEAVTVVDQKKIEAARMVNVKDALNNTPGVLIDSRNGGYDARLIIRGAGLKASYGIREVMILRDGVPITDPDSMSRLDFIDPQEIERVEVTRGPGSLYATGSSGGAVQVISRSVFDQTPNRAKASLGTDEAQAYHLRYGGWLNESNAVALAVSQRSQDNSWRRWNSFDTDQMSLKHGWMSPGGTTVESELGYTKADLQLPGSMSADQFATFQESGKQTDTQDAWKHSGRYSEVWFVNSKVEKEMGSFTFKPRFYLTQWSHYHPVTGVINESDNNWVMGTDLEFNHRHHLLGEDSLAAGLTLRRDQTNDARKYKYADISESSRGRITSTLSDDRGDLLETEDSVNNLYGIFLQESLRPLPRLIVDVGMRLDRSRFAIDTNEMEKYDYASGNYTTGAGQFSTDKTFTLWSPKIGATYAITPHLNLFGVIAQSDQVPATSELSNNPALDTATSRNHEIGLKGRWEHFSFDTSVYYNPVEDEIIAVLVNDETTYVNAGKTHKQGLEATAAWKFNEQWQLGGSYAFSDYTFDQFQEEVDDVMVDRSGNQLPFVPRHQYGLFVDWSHPMGLKARVQTDTWGEYYTDNANSEMYEGYDFLTRVMVGYEKGPHGIQLNVDNLFDEYYAAEVKKDTNGKLSYYAGEPRTIFLTYQYKFQ